MVHGARPEDVEKDLEGLQIMRFLGRNMAYMLKCKEAGLKTGVSLPRTEKVIFTNFIHDRPRTVGRGTDLEDRSVGSFLFIFLFKISMWTCGRSKAV